MAQIRRNFPRGSALVKVKGLRQATESNSANLGLKPG
jgi:hypothetical protein